MKPFKATDILKYVRSKSIAANNSADIVRQINISPQYWIKVLNIELIINIGLNPQKESNITTDNSTIGKKKIPRVKSN